MTAKLVIASRGDGFGARLVAILNAMYVAECTGLEFKFTWPKMRADSEFHAVPSVEEMFSPEFINAYYDPLLDLSRFEDSHNTPVTQAQISKIIESADTLGLNVKTCDAISQVYGREAPVGTFPRLWEEVGFAQRISEMFRLGRESVNAETIAVHCRRGDTVTGVYRYRLFNYKYFPTAYVKALLADAALAGRQVLFFSDDAHIEDQMRREFGVITTEELSGGLVKNQTEEAIFDLGAMSACQDIVCTHSVFAILAGFIGKSPRKDPITAFEDFVKRMHLCRPQALSSDVVVSFVHGVKISTILGDLEANRAAYSPLERAKELQWVANELLSQPLNQMSPVGIAKRDSLLAEAQGLDPENLTYGHLRALNAARNGEFDKAEALLADAATHHFIRGNRTSPDLAPNFNILDERFASAFKRASEGGEYPYLTGFYAYCVLSLKGHPQSLDIFKQAYDLAPNSDVLLAAYASSLVATGAQARAGDLLNNAFNEGRDAAILRDIMVGVADAAGDKVAAIFHCRAAIHLAPEMAYYRIRLAWFLSRRKQYNEASEIIDAIDAARLDSATDVYLLSKVNERLGRHEQAVAMSRRAVVMRPSKKNYRARLDALEKQEALLAN